MPELHASDRARMTDDQAARLALDELRVALKNTRPNVWIIPVLAAIVCAMFSRWVSLGTLALWFGLVIAGLVPMQMIAAAFLRDEKPVEDMQIWRIRCIVGNALFTLCWAAMGPLLWVPDDSFNHTILLLILCSSLAGDAALMSASRPLSFTGSIVYGTIIVLLPLNEGGFIYDMLALSSLFFALYMFHLSTQIHATTRRMLLLRNDKNDLIEALAAAKRESDAARERAEKASRSKSEFLANMSHELRTPLNAVLGFSEMIYSTDFNPDRHAEYARIIHTSGHHLLALINDILDLAKIEAGGLKLRDRQFDIAAAFADCVQLLSVKADAGGLQMQLDIAPQLPLFYGDERAMRQVMINLLSNAIKFTPPGGKVTAFLQTASDGTLALGVSDTGVGIAPEDQEHVFQNFGQGRHDVVTADKGTGLGLPIVKGLVQAHGGHIALKSAVGEGTTVTAYFPPERLRGPVALAAAS